MAKLIVLKDELLKKESLRLSSKGFIILYY